MWKAIRWVLGRIVLTKDFLTRPTPAKHDEARQAALDAKTKNLSLYQYHACPFCVKVRREIRRHALTIELRDAKVAPHNQDLQTGGGRLKVPCLRIDNGDKTTWLYESDEIINYLRKKIQEA